MPPQLPRLSSKRLAAAAAPWNHCSSPPANSGASRTDAFSSVFLEPGSVPEKAGVRNTGQLVQNPEATRANCEAESTNQIAWLKMMGVCREMSLIRNGVTLPALSTWWLLNSESEAQGSPD